jgi:hypothetical protein
MKKRVIAQIALAAVIMGAGIDASAANPVTNGGFETGNFSGWTLSAANKGAVVTSSKGDAPLSSLTYTAPEGSHFAKIVANGGKGLYTTLTSSAITLNKNDGLTGQAAFDYRDFRSFAVDAAYVEILDSAKKVVATPWSILTSSSTTPYWDGPWTTWSWTASSAGTYYVQYGVANVNDGSYPSYALFDNLTDPPGGATVPEPASMLLICTGLPILLKARKKEQAA